MTSLHHFIPSLTGCGLAALLAGCASTDSFMKLDTNRDGSGSPSEFDTYMKKEVFARVDTENDGKVTRVEWQQCNPKVSDTKFSKTDTNRDNCISRPEADAAFDREGSLKKLFGKIDSDLNGGLSPSEVSAFHSNPR